jgi:hypothetical protein
VGERKKKLENCLEPEVDRVLLMLVEMKLQVVGEYGDVLRRKLFFSSTIWSSS